MATAFFIDETFLKESTAIAGNVDVKELMPFIAVAQEAYIQDLTGTALYQELQAAIIGNAVSADQAQLLSLIRPALAWYTLLKALPFLNFKVRPKAVTRGDGEGTEPSDLQVIKYLREEVRSTAEFLGARVVSYLSRNCNKFPSYSSEQVDIRPAASSYNSPVVFDADLMSDEERAFYKKFFS